MGGLLCKLVLPSASADQQQAMLFSNASLLDIRAMPYGTWPYGADQEDAAAAAELNSTEPGQ